jgi:hypothetical protein
VGHGGEEPPAGEMAGTKGTTTGPISTLPPYDSGKIGINRRVARKQAAQAGILVAVFLTLSYFLSPIFLLIPLGGFFAVRRYLQEIPGQRLSPGAGAGIGLLTGLLGFLFCGIPYISTISWCLAIHSDCLPVRSLRAQISLALQANPNPQLQQVAQSLLAPSGVFFFAMALCLLTLILTLLLSAIGGAIGANLSKRR